MVGRRDHRYLQGRSIRKKRIKAAAYATADGGPTSTELAQLYYIDRFGASAVMGRPLAYLEIEEMMMAEKVTRLYRERERAEDWVKWAKNKPEDAEFLGSAMILAGEHEQ